MLTRSLVLGGGALALLAALWFSFGGAARPDPVAPSASRAVVPPALTVAPSAPPVPTQAVPASPTAAAPVGQGVAPSVGPAPGDPGTADAADAADAAVGPGDPRDVDLALDQRDLPALDAAPGPSIGADAAAVAVPSSYPVGEAAKYFVPRERRRPGNLGGPPPLDFPGGPNDPAGAGPVPPPAPGGGG